MATHMNFKYEICVHNSLLKETLSATISTILFHRALGLCIPQTREIFKAQLSSSSSASSSGDYNKYKENKSGKPLSSYKSFDTPSSQFQEELAGYHSTPIDNDSEGSGLEILPTDNLEDYTITYPCLLDPQIDIMIDEKTSALIRLIPSYDNNNSNHKRPSQPKLVASLVIKFNKAEQKKAGWFSKEEEPWETWILDCFGKRILSCFFQFLFTI